MTLDPIRIREAVKKAKAQGWTIGAGTFIAREKTCCCPLGAVALDHDPRASTALSILEKTLCFNEGDVAGFAWGFDGNERPWRGAEAAYALGREFRRELLGDAGGGG